MGSLQAPSGAESRRAVGDDVIEAAAHIDTSPIKSRFDAFKKTHATYSVAQKKVQVADAPLSAQYEINGELDAALDEAVMRLADALAKEGMPRLNPFRGLSTFAPSTLVRLGYAAEAREVHLLVKKVLAKKGLSKATIAAAKAADAAATQLEATLKKVAPLKKAYDTALTQRDGLIPSWEAAFAKLKAGARFADDEGAVGLFEALFGTTVKPKKPKKKPPTTPAT